MSIYTATYTYTAVAAVPIFIQLSACCPSCLFWSTSVRSSSWRLPTASIAIHLHVCSAVIMLTVLSGPERGKRFRALHGPAIADSKRTKYAARTVAQVLAAAGRRQAAKLEAAKPHNAAATAAKAAARKAADKARHALKKQ
eukprot:19876-Heterococcus_DN1.PRE.3